MYYQLSNIQDEKLKELEQAKKWQQRQKMKIMQMADFNSDHKVEKSSKMDETFYKKTKLEVNNFYML